MPSERLEHSRLANGGESPCRGFGLLSGSKIAPGRLAELIAAFVREPAAG